MENVKVEIFRNETGEGLAIIASTPNAQKVFIAENEQDARNVKVFVDSVLDYSDELNNLEVVVINYADGDFGVLAKGSDEIFCNPFKVRKHAEEVKNFVEEIIAMATAQNDEDTGAASEEVPTDDSEFTESNFFDDIFKMASIKNGTAFDDNESADEEEKIIERKKNCGEYYEYCELINLKAARIIKLQNAIRELTDAKTACDFLLMDLHRTYRKVAELERTEND